MGGVEALLSRRFGILPAHRGQHPPNHPTGLALRSVLRGAGSTGRDSRRRGALRSAEGIVMARPQRSGIWHTIRGLLGRTWLRAFGWRVEGDVPSEPRFIAIAAPHTSYWDFPHMIAFGFATGQYISFLMKDSLFAGPMGILFRGLGGVPVDRSQPGGLVESVAKAFEGREELIVVIAPEGSRSRRPGWKSGFHHIALRAGVPIALGFLDYSRKVVGFGPVIWPEKDGNQELLAAFYADKRGRYPELESPPRLSDLIS